MYLHDIHSTKCIYFNEYGKLKKKKNFLKKAKMRLREIAPITHLKNKKYKQQFQLQTGNRLRMQLYTHSVA